MKILLTILSHKDSGYAKNKQQETVSTILIQDKLNLRPGCAPSSPGMYAIFAWDRLDPRRRPSRSPDKVKKDFSTA